MNSRYHVLARLLELPTITDSAVARGIVRQALATLGQDDPIAAPMALAGVDPRALARSVEVASRDGHLEDLGFLRPADAAAALHQIGAALPHGAERRAIGRRVLTALYQGDAETFAELASRMALGATRSLDGVGVRARVELCLALGSQLEASTNRLALAIAMRRELARDWITNAATAALPDRQMAARLIERAAKEAVRRAERGDRHPLRVFHATARPRGTRIDARSADLEIGAAWDLLLADRESLVWRHVAIARGVLAVEIPELADLTRSLLAPEHSPTEWRRGAASLVASICVDRERALEDAHALLAGPLLRRDPGIAMAMVWGLDSVVDAEPEAAEELLDALAATLPIPIAESVVELRARHPDFGARAAEECRAALRASLSRTETDDGVTTLARLVASELDDTPPSSRLAARIHEALSAYREHGARQALEAARSALDEARGATSALVGIDVRYDQGQAARVTRERALPLLRDVDAHLLESHTLRSLLLLGRPPGSTASGVEPLDDVHSELVPWLSAAGRPSANEGDLEAQATMVQRELRALLHLIDAGHTEFGDDGERKLLVRQRWTAVVAAFTRTVRLQPAGKQTRARLATVARALDALVRDGSAEPVDVLLFVATHLTEPGHVAVIAEASMHPDVTEILGAYLGFVRATVSGPQSEQARARLEAWRRFLEVFPSQTTTRTEALRITSATLGTALSAILRASSLRSLLPESPGADTGELVLLEDSILQLQQLVVGAERRTADFATRSHMPFPRRHALAQATTAVVHASRGEAPEEGQSNLAAEFFDALTLSVRAAEAVLPGPIAALVSSALPLLAGLAVDRTSIAPTMPRSETRLPDWVPARRVIGGFYIVRPLGGGNVGSVFVVTRADERRDKNATQFALKVPEYNAVAARTMAEAEFLRFFREEAGALLSIPEHPNVASFVTFDAGAKPKPILVMELVDGVNCERILGAQGFTMPLALGVLDGMLAGLEAMHSVGIAHLDIKPSNVILRTNSSEAVLVDLGLAGRKVRPGCATLCYGAPEIWTTDHSAAHLLPASAADVYAFGSSAYELLTGKTLFDSPSDVAIIARHLAHDGLPPELAALGSRPHLVGFLGACLRQDPQSRATVRQLRAALPGVRAELEGARWPLT